MKPYKYVKKANYKALKASLFIILWLLTIAIVLFMWNSFSWGEINSTTHNVGIFTIVTSVNDNKIINEWYVSLFSKIITIIISILLIVYGALSIRYAATYNQPGRAPMMYSWIIFLLTFVIMLILAFEIGEPNQTTENFSFFHWEIVNEDGHFKSLFYLNWVAYTVIAILGTLEFSALISGIIGSIKIITK